MLVGHPRVCIDGSGTTETRNEDLGQDSGFEIRCVRGCVSGIVYHQKVCRNERCTAMIGVLRRRWGILLLT